MILTKEVEVRPKGKSIQYYKDKGYDVRYNEPLIVDIDDLPLNSNVKVLVKCDYCGEEVQRSYIDYIKSIKKFGAYACRKCGVIHQRKTFLERYGYEHALQVPEIKEKQIRTVIERYGVDNALKNEEIKKKSMETNLKKYGVPIASQAESVKQKAVNTFMEKYGVCNPFQVPEFKEKAKHTYQKKYGVDHANKSPEVREKQVQSLYKNSSQKCSKQQFHIYNLYNTDGTAELNYPISYYNVDICFPAERLVVEYDGGGHNLNVITGRITEAEFRRREIARDRTLKKEGYHLMRIISADDKLPSDNILLQMLEHTKEYFATYPEHSWVEFDLDASTVRNAEHKDGSFFN